MIQGTANCFDCNKNKIEYLQIEDVKLKYGLCQECFQNKENKHYYQNKKQFLQKYNDKLKNEFPNLYKLYQLKRSYQKLIDWKNKISPYIEDVFQFLENGNYTYQNFSLLITLFSKTGHSMEKSAVEIIQFLNITKFNRENLFSFEEQNKNILFQEKFSQYLLEIINKQEQAKEIINYINKSIELQFSDIPKQFQNTGNYIKDSYSNKDAFYKYFGYVNLVDLKHGKGILIGKDTIYYGIFNEDVFIYGIKFELIQEDEGQFFFGTFDKDEIQNKGKMIAYKLEKNILYQEYEGDFKDGLRNGKGKYQWIQNNNILISLNAEWQNNIQNGIATIKKSDQISFFTYENGKIKQQNPNNNQNQLRTSFCPTPIQSVQTACSKQNQFTQFQNLNAQSQAFQTFGQQSQSQEFKLNNQDPKSINKEQNGRKTFQIHGTLNQQGNFNTVQANNNQPQRAFQQSTFQVNSVNPSITSQQLNFNSIQDSQKFKQFKQ